MTTREEMALTFAVANYKLSTQVGVARAQAGHLPPTEEELCKTLNDTIRGAVELADALINELSKQKPDNAT
jgi:hypothetical protein